MHSHFFLNLGSALNLIALFLLVSCAAESSNTSSLPANNYKNEIQQNQESNIASVELRLGDIDNKIQDIENDIKATADYLNSQNFVDFLNSLNEDKGNAIDDQDIISALIKAQNRINYIEEKIFYGDSLYFEIINDLVVLENKINRLSMKMHDSEASKKTEPTITISTAQEFENEYKKAYYAFTKGDYSLSMELFKNLISIDNNNDLSDNCQYWISEIYYAKGEFQIALNEFKKVLEYKNTNKGAESLYKLGLCYLKFGNINEATKSFSSLESLYPEKNVLIDKSKKHLEQGK